MVPIGLARQVMLATMATPALTPASRQACRHNDLEVELRDGKQLFERLGHFDAIASAEPQPEAGRSA